MANQPEQPIFDSGVYQLETADPVLGGSGGLSNIPLLNLANRTRWLKQEVDAINTTLPTKAPLNSPALTGTPTAPTQSLENATTRIASTAFARGIVSGKMEKVLSGTSGVTLTDAEAGNGLLLFSGAITAAVNIVVPDASRRWIVRNATSGGFPVTVKTATAAGVAVPSGMALELWCDGAVVRTVAANAWATPRKIALNGPVTGEVMLDGSADVAMQTAVLAATDGQSGLVELATGAETVAGTDGARAVTPAGLASLTATTSRRGLVELATDAEVNAGTDAERAVTPAALKTALLAAFPVGAVYITAGNTNPGSFLGGTWAQIAAGRTLMGVGTLGTDTYAAGDTGGAARVTLTTTEMPAHNHDGTTGGQSAGHTHSGTTASAGAHTHTYKKFNGWANGGGGSTNTTIDGNGAATYFADTATTSEGAHTHTITTGANSADHTHAITSQGSGGAHENRPPYLAVYFWQRTA